MAALLILLVCFVLTWFATLPQPFFIILCVIEAIALALLVEPLAFRHGALF